VSGEAQGSPDPVRGELDYMDNLRRRRAFREAHPAAEFCRVGGWEQAFLPAGNGGGILVTREDLGELMDVLEAEFADGDEPDSG